MSLHAHTNSEAGEHPCLQTSLCWNCFQLFLAVSSFKLENQIPWNWKRDPPWIPSRQREVSHITGLEIRETCRQDNGAAVRVVKVASGSDLLNVLKWCDLIVLYLKSRLRMSQATSASNFENSTCLCLGMPGTLIFYFQLKSGSLHCWKSNVQRPKENLRVHKQHSKVSVSGIPHETSKDSQVERLHEQRKGKSSTSSICNQLSFFWHHNVVRIQWFGFEPAQRHFVLTWFSKDPKST